jgi:hypothetical protein
LSHCCNPGSDIFPLRGCIHIFFSGSNPRSSSISLPLEISLRFGGENLLEAPPSFVQRRLSARHLSAWSRVCFCQWASVFWRRFNPDASLETQTPIQLSSDETHFARGRPGSSNYEQRTPVHINPLASLEICRRNLPEMLYLKSATDFRSIL